MTNIDTEYADVRTNEFWEVECDFGNGLVTEFVITRKESGSDYLCERRNGKEAYIHISCFLRPVNAA